MLLMIVSRFLNLNIDSEDFVQRNWRDFWLMACCTCLTESERHRWQRQVRIDLLNERRSIGGINKAIGLTDSSCRTIEMRTRALDEEDCDEECKGEEWVSCGTEGIYAGDMTDDRTQRQPLGQISASGGRAELAIAVQLLCNHESLEWLGDNCEQASAWNSSEVIANPAACRSFRSAHGAFQPPAPNPALQAHHPLFFSSPMTTLELPLPAAC